MMFLLKPMSNQNDFAWQGGLEASILPGKSQRSEALLARGCLFGRGKVEAVEEEEVDKEVDKEVAMEVNKEVDREVAMEVD